MPPQKDTTSIDALNNNPKMLTILNPKKIGEFIAKFFINDLPTIRIEVCYK